MYNTKNNKYVLKNNGNDLIIVCCTGFYMYISALGRNAGQRAWFYSQYFLKTKATCMSFWYFMYGQGNNFDF